MGGGGRGRKRPVTRPLTHSRDPLPLPPSPAAWVSEARDLATYEAYLLKRAEEAHKVVDELYARERSVAKAAFDKQRAVTTAATATSAYAAAVSPPTAAAPTGATKGKGASASKATAAHAAAAAAAAAASTFVFTPSSTLKHVMDECVKHTTALSRWLHGEWVGGVGWGGGWGG
jgi:hypothetical protein